MPRKQKKNMNTTMYKSVSHGIAVAIFLVEMCGDKHCHLTHKKIFKLNNLSTYFSSFYYQ